GASAPRTLAALFDIAVATSGDGVRHFEVFGQRYSHTLDGRTGRPIRNGVASVSVFADTALRADAFATALTVMGPEDGAAWAEAMEIAALFTVRSPAGFTEIITPAAAAMLEEGAA
ncbi:MAG TPA: FAD:protein FMN transferase, partial [Brevundimonas sp.]|nr:FAD:protein FMN transferase [Brevundimonas sp.]